MMDQTIEDMIVDDHEDEKMDNEILNGLNPRRIGERNKSESNTIIQKLSIGIAPKRRRKEKQV